MLSCYQLSLIVISCLTEFLLGGSIWGWNSLLLVMKDEGIYTTDVQFNTIYTTMIAVSSAFILFQGAINDLFGPKWLLLSSNILTAIGFLLISFSRYIDVLRFAGLVIFAIGAGGYHMSLLTSASLISPEHCRITMSLYNSFYDAGSIVFYLYYLIYQKTLFSSVDFFTYYAIAPVLLIPTFFIWPNPELSIRNSFGKFFVDLKKHVSTKIFLFLLTYNIIFTYWFNVYFGNVSARSGTTSSNTGPLAYFSLILPIISISTSPLVAYLMKKDLEWRYIILYMIALSWTVMLINVQSTVLTYMTFIAFGLLRAFYYPMVSDYISKYFEPNMFGRIYSCLIIINAPITATQIPLLQVGLSVSFWISDGIQITSFILLFIFVLYQIRKSPNIL